MARNGEIGPERIGERWIALIEYAHVTPAAAVAFRCSMCAKAHPDGQGPILGVAVLDLDHQSWQWLTPLSTRHRPRLRFGDWSGMDTGWIAGPRRESSLLPERFWAEFGISEDKQLVCRHGHRFRKHVRWLASRAQQAVGGGYDELYVGR